MLVMFYYKIFEGVNMSVNFVNLHTQTDYSILDSLISVKDLFKKVKELDQKAVAITEHGSLASAWEALKESKNTGIKLIIGCEFFFKDTVNNEKLQHVILLAKNEIGYKNILILNKKGFDQNYFIGKRIYPIINWNLLEQYCEGTICLTACGNGIISQPLMNGKIDEAEQSLLRLKNIFGDNLGIEIQPNNMKREANIYNDEIDQQFLNRKLIDLGKKHNIRVVAACNAHYLLKEEHEIHDVLLSIGSHQPIYSTYRLRYPVSEFYLKSGDEVKIFFERNYENAEQFCENSIYFSNLCEEPDWIDPKFSNPSGKELPYFPVKDDESYEDFKKWLCNQNDYIKNLSEDKSFLRYKVEISFFKQNIEEDKIEQYKERIIKEFDVLEHLDLSSYMLITADFLDFARKNGISVGPGRGSCGGSYIAYLLNIHNADSIKYDLTFERFHNKLKLATSDIDNDICTSGRDKVIEYVTNKYGEDNVAHVSNISKNKPKVYIRDVARACELGGSREAAVKIGNDVASSISADISSIDEALNKSPLFVEFCKKYPEFIKYKKICNKPRCYACHAAGVLIAKRSLIGLVPVKKDKDGIVSVEYDKDVAEENGLVKIDFLGLNTLDIIDKTYELIKKANKKLPIIDVEAYDKDTYDLISEGDTFGVFQFGKSAGAIDLCKKIKPKNMEDLAIITTLVRPASKDFRTDFIKTKAGKMQVTLLHSTLQNAFNKTYGFPLYDESLLTLAKDVAGWDLGDADKLRKLTKEKGKNPKKVKKWKEEFIEGAKNNGLHEQEALNIWEKIVEPWGNYSFNKSHAVLYSMISFKQAYLKAHYPVEFLLANLMAEVNSNSQSSKSNIVKIKKELRERRIKIIAPDINKSQLTYTIDGNKLITGLDALKFVGDEAINDIIEKRPFKDFFDFMSRIDSKKVRSNNIQALIASGSLDCFKISRKLMFLYCSDYRKKLQVWCKKHDPLKEEFIYPWAEDKEWSTSELYALEHFYLGESFICKPYQAYGDFFKDQHNTISDIKKVPDKTTIPSTKAIIKDFFEFKVKKETSKYYGMPMIKAEIEDMNGDQCVCTIFPDKWKEVQQRIKQIHSKALFDSGLAISFSGNTNNYEDNIGIILNNLYNIGMIPALPIDLKARKINLKDSKPIEIKPNETEDLFEKLEDLLYDEGLIDIDNDND
jgi:DNA polymerase-3 subunit alpha